MVGEAQAARLGTERTAGRIVAAATGDPLAHATFSGYSRRLFEAVREQGREVEPVATRQLRWYDALTGHVSPLAALPSRRGDRQRSLVNPEWYWSRRAFDRFSDGLDRRLRSVPGPRVVVQIGTHVRSRLPDTALYCVTDATIPQAVRAGEFSVSRASADVLREAQACQADVLAASRLVFVLSAWAKESVVEDYGVAESRVVVLGAGANVATTLPRRVDLAAPFVLFVGADWQQKGGPLLLEAVRRARERVPALRLVVVGCSPELDEPGVEVVGRLPRDDPRAHQRLLELYASAACFSIVPRFDAFPNVLLEAAAFGVPVVSTAEGSRPEAVVHGETGLLVPERDPDRLAEAIVTIVTDPATAARLGENAARRAAELYTWPGVARHLLERIDETWDGR